jgi:hypothetical protein
MTDSLGNQATSSPARSFPIASPSDTGHQGRAEASPISPERCPVHARIALVPQSRARDTAAVGAPDTTRRSTGSTVPSCPLPATAPISPSGPVVVAGRLVPVRLHARQDDIPDDQFPDRPEAKARARDGVVAVLRAVCRGRCPRRSGQLRRARPQAVGAAVGAVGTDRVVPAHAASWRRSSRWPACAS